ncbi:MAG: protein kinase, partial [Anaerolineae bacterium]|nr:protein kinase [Anaerolineae bacterium]
MFKPFKPENLIGREVGSYKLIQVLGGGGQGFVYKAAKEDSLILSDVDKYKAVKIFFKSPTDTDLDFTERFLREMKTIYHLHICPNIVRVSEHGILDEEFPYIMMDFYEKGTLDDLAKEHGRIPLPDLLAALKDVAAALDAAHSEGVIHRDIKPSNILFNKSKRAVLGDFGISKSKLQESYTPSNKLMGTLAFTAPEVLNGNSANERSDFYSLGIMTYYLLSGQQPNRRFVAGVNRDRSSKNLPSDLHKYVSVELATVVNRMIDPDPDKRYLSAGQFVADLEAAAKAANPYYDPSPTILIDTSDIPSQEHSSDPPTKLYWWNTIKSRLSGWIVVGIAAVVVALVGGILLLSGGDDEKKEVTQEAASAPTNTSGSAFSLSTATATESLTDTPQPMATETEAPTASATDTVIPTATATDTQQPTATATTTSTATTTTTSTATFTATVTFTATFTASPTATATLPPSATFTELPSLTPTLNVPLPLTAFDNGLQASALITNKQYQKCQGCSMPSDPTLYLNPLLENKPIVGVTWFNAQDFCGMYGGRLPTDSEWVNLQKSGLLRSDG